MTWELQCGAYTLYIIEDGYYWRDPATYYEKSTEHDWRFHTRNDRGQARLNFGCYLLTDGEHTMMVDAGVGEIDQEGMTTGLMPEAVDALGVPRESVETVVYTHMHYDHIGGSQRSGKLVFPEARHVFHRGEWEFWKTVDSDFGKAARRIMQPLFDAGVVDFIDGGIEVLAGITAFESFGHTPGHLSVRLESEGTTTLLGGDVSNHPFQVEHPQWSLPVDNDHELCGDTRDQIFESIKDTGTSFLAGHYPMPGVGRIVTSDGVRLYQPLTPRIVGERAPLEGTWMVMAYRAGDELVKPSEDGAEATITIEGSRVSGTMGVNRFTGQMTGGLITEPLATTRMAGPPELMEQEDVLLRLLTETDRIAVDGDGMTLSRDGLNLVELQRSGTAVTPRSS